MLIVGGGVMGASAARSLAADGRRVVLLEAATPAHAGGSSHGDGRIARWTYPEPFYLAMAQRSFTLWRQIEKLAGEPLLERTGSWECGPVDCPQLREQQATFDAAGIRYQRWSARGSKRSLPQFELPEGSEVIYQPDGAVLRAERAVRALWRLAESAGARMLSGRRVDAIEVDDEGCMVGAGTERWRVSSLVITAGAWTPSLVAALGVDLPIQPTRETVAYFSPSAHAARHHVDHRLGTMPTVVDYHDGERPFFALPQIELGGVKAGWHHSGQEIEMPVGDQQVAAEPDAEPDAEALEMITAWVADRMPYLDHHPQRVETCLYSNTPDRHFILDRHPSLPRVIIAGGFSGHGFKFAPVIGELLSDWLAERQPRIDVEPFRLSRFEVLSDGQGLVRRTSA